MSPGQSLSQLTSKILINLESLFRQDRPDLVLAHGDTTTCFGTALSCFYHQIPFFHVEAGLRSHRLESPFPEEFNRQTIAPLATHHFAPTPLEKDNLLKDGISSSAITVTGSTIHEAVMEMQRQTASMTQTAVSSLDDSRPLVVVTLHRRESAQALENILTGIKNAAMTRKDAVFICPIHPNPVVKSAFKTYLSGSENIILTDPIGYPQFISLLMKSRLIVTDSGGVQEEAAFLGKQVLLARTETERDDGLRAGFVKLIGSCGESIQGSILDELARTQPRTIYKPFNDAKSASEIIADRVLRSIG
jgi:UDP-N-acetylglucosamine 2-epimerase (non-hydrolysing)